MLSGKFDIFVVVVVWLRLGFGFSFGGVVCLFFFSFRQGLPL